MKQLHIAAIIATLFLSISSLAQESHLQFKGIPIDGNYVDFAQKLIQKGFKQEEVTDYGIVLRGTFMATPEVMVTVHPEPVSKVVSYVVASIDAGDNWTSIEQKYYQIVDTYKQKYGEPKSHTEEFTTIVEDDYDRLKAIRDNKCVYKSEWFVNNGGIGIALFYYQYTYYVICGYMDEQNMMALKQSIIDDI